MPEESSPISVKLDVAGAEALSKAVAKASDATVDGASAFLSRICLPGAEEFGYLLRDRISGWRQRNGLKIAAKAERLAAKLGAMGDLSVHPRLACMAIDDGSWAETDEVQDMWAGLLIASHSNNGESDANLVFLNLLKQLTKQQARLFNHFCSTCGKIRSPVGFVHARPLTMTVADLLGVAGTENPHEIDVNLDYLRELGLLNPNGGFNAAALELIADVTPSAFGLSFYARCQGFVGDASSYYVDAVNITTAMQMDQREGEATADFGEDPGNPDAP